MKYDEMRRKRFKEIQDTISTIYNQEKEEIANAIGLKITKKRKREMVEFYNKLHPSVRLDDSDVCACCGEYVAEGSMICIDCQEKIK